MEVFRMLKEILKTMRPIQWYKNILIFVGIIFSFNITTFSLYPVVILAFVVFCTVSGCVYIFNDIVDRKRDQRHPTKRFRPIASGSLPVSVALVVGILLLGLSFIASYYFISLLFLVVVLSYFVLTNLYNYWFRRVVVVDVLIIAIAFVLRAIAGAVAINVSISPWLIICTLLLALFLALGKRRHELIIMDIEAVEYRRSLGEYSVEMLEGMLNIAAAVTIMSYSLYTFLAATQWMMMTIPFAIFGLFKYLQLIHKRNIGEEPEIILKNKAMVTSILLWGLTILIVLYDVPTWIVNLLTT